MRYYHGIKSAAVGKVPRVRHRLRPVTLVMSHVSPG
jgi:hypothetical protein